MKHIIYLIAVIFLFGCQKDEKLTEPNNLGFNESIVTWNGSDRKPTVIDETGARIGTFLPLFYKESVTTDNWTTLDTIHTQEAFNKKQIDSVFLSRVEKTNKIKIQNVVHLYYKLVFKLTDGTELVYGKVWSVDAGNIVKYAVFGDNVIEVLGFKVTVKRHKETVKYGDWKTGTNKTKHRYSVLADTTNLYNDWINGTNGGIFLMPHK